MTLKLMTWNEMVEWINDTMNKHIALLINMMYSWAWRISIAMFVLPEGKPVNLYFCQFWIVDHCAHTPQTERLTLMEEHHFL